MIGTLLKMRNGWYVKRIEEGDGKTYYPLHSSSIEQTHKDLLVLGNKVIFEIIDEFTNPQLFENVAWGESKKYAYLKLQNLNKKNMEKIIYKIKKIWFVISREIPKFFYNFWLFRKDLYNYTWYSGESSLFPFMITALRDMAHNIEVQGNEVEESSSKKIMKMYLASVIMENFINDNFIERAEKELGELILHDWEFKPSENHPGSFELVDKDLPEEKEHNTKIINRAQEIEESDWKELWSIFQGQDYTKFDKNIDWNKQFDGTGLRGYWDQ